MTEPILTIAPGYNLVKRPVWSVVVHRSTSGRRVAGTNQAYPTWEFDLPFNALRQADQTALLGLFNQCSGPRSGFLFADPSDQSITGQVIGIGDGLTTEWQLIRTYGGFTEPCRRIKATPEPVIYVGGEAVGGGFLVDDFMADNYPGFLETSGASFSLDYDTGLLTFETAPLAGQTIVADFSYYYLVAFKSGNFDMEGIGPFLWKGSVTLESLKE